MTCGYTISYNDEPLCAQQYKRLSELSAWLTKYVNEGTQEPCPLSGFWLSAGLCQNLTGLNFIRINGWPLACRSWERFSGYLIYPVPHPAVGSLVPTDAADAAARMYHISIERGTLYTGEYGRLRARLLQHYVSCFKKVAI